MLGFLLLILNALNIVKSEKIQLDNFKLESNNLYSLAKFTYNNYSRNNPIKQGFDFYLKTNNSLSKKYQKENKTLLVYFYFILSEPSLSIKNNERFCRFGLTGKDENDDEKISFIKKYHIHNNNNNTSDEKENTNKTQSETTNINENNLEYLENGIKEEFLFDEIGVKEFYK
jgi:hypothetical protein